MSTEGVQPTPQDNGNSANPVLSAPTGNGTVTNPTPQAATTNEQNGNARNGNVVEEIFDVGKLKSAVWSHMLRFAYVSAPHTAERLGTMLVNCLLDWNVDNDAASGARVLEGCFSPTSEANLIQLQPDAETTEGNKQKTLFQLCDFFQPLIYVNEIEIVCLNVFCLSFVALAAGWNQGMQNAALLLLLESGVWRPEVKSLSCCCAAAAIEAVLE
ncbi:unnamed protein product [Linum trigynum]|uniref:Uncharacterized protein n=1 Tax=Linum trigynum TaxID=586398 RepID=A0AAV2G092_9ROSI